MLKDSFFKRVAIGSLFLLLALILYNFPKELTLSSPDKVLDNKIFLVDSNEFVAQVNVSCDINDDSVEGVFELLINSSCLPDGFSSFVPALTKLLDYSIDDGLLKVNFSKDILDVKKGYEEKMLEMLIYSFTSIDGVNEIMIFVEGERLEKIPNTDKLLPATLDRTFGINKVIDITTLNDNVSFNVYYLGKYGNDYYYIPVTYIVNEDNDVADMIIKRLKSNNISSSLLTHINYNVEMISYEMDGNSIGITFDDDLKNILFDGELSESIEYVLTASFKDSFGVKDVNILFNS